ncbi:hypothetical protein CHISP_0539 [Chitinispirillum alkaliphilum]|nr:hypothetical protein CHISP_0539 [Chitinispirillum alkaliphilum]
MVPIQKLLSRIRWDKSFGNAEFEIVYEDRIVGLVKIPLERVVSVDRSSFTLEDELGRLISVPLHRIRSVYRNGQLVWSRI